MANKKVTANNAMKQTTLSWGKPAAPALKPVEDDKKLDGSAVKGDTEMSDAAVVPQKRKQEVEEADNEANEGTTSAKNSSKSSKRRKKVVDDDEEEEEQETKPSLKPAPIDHAMSAVPAADTDATKTKRLPSDPKFDPVNDATWEPLKPVPYMVLAKAFEEIEKLKGSGTGSGKKMKEILTNIFRSIILLTPGDLVSCVYLCINRIAPDYENIELGVGESLLIKAIAEACGKSEKQVKMLSEEAGDLGIVAESSRTTQMMLVKPQPLTIKKVFGDFMHIATDKGQNAMGKKKDRIKQLLVASKECEAKFIVRSLQGKMRMGVASASVLSALAAAVSLSPPAQTFPPAVKNTRKALSEQDYETKVQRAEESIKAAFSELPNYQMLIEKLLEGGDIEELPLKCHLTAGIPVKPMLAKPTTGVTEVLDRFQNVPFTCEYKYDGERAQIHKLEDGRVLIFSRNSENMTEKYPDIAQVLPRAMRDSCNSFILDCEAVAFDRTTEKLLPFQIISSRSRKNVTVENIKVQVCVFAFDLIYINGTSLLRTSLDERRRLLREHFVDVPGSFAFAKYHNGNTIEEMQTFFQESVVAGCEGLMVKTLEQDSTYEPSKRSNKWLKLKKDYMVGMADSVDLVPIGAYLGMGKRTGVYGAFLLACYDEDTEEYQSICKIGTGFSDEDLKVHAASLNELKIDSARSYYRITDSNKPDVWFEPKQVWEVRAADLSISPAYMAAVGEVDDEKGISLRFPRFIRIRDDKAATDATNSKQIAEMYRNQKVFGESNGGAAAIKKGQIAEDDEEEVNEMETEKIDDS